MSNSPVRSEWKQSLTHNNNTITAEGREGDESIQLTIEEPGAGLIFRRKATMTVTGTDWEGFVAKIARCRRDQPKDATASTETK